MSVDCVLILNRVFGDGLRSRRKNFREKKGKKMIEQDKKFLTHASRARFFKLL